MNYILLIIFLWSVVFVQSLVGQGLAKGVQPCVIIHHYSPKSSSSHALIQWDCPVFAAYTDNTVIWRRNWTASLTALAMTNNNEYAEEIVKEVEKMMEDNGGKLYEITNSSDPEVTTVWFKGKTLTILGDWLRPHRFEATTLGDEKRVALENENAQKLWAKLPNEIRKILTKIYYFNASNGRTWHPERLALLLQPASKQTNFEPIAWPIEWPQTFERIEGSSMKQLELPGSMLSDLLQLIPDDGMPKAILLAGEIRYAGLRLLFPGVDESENEPTSQP